jgi:O-antigen/teichoic acid export membrane protein
MAIFARELDFRRDVIVEIAGKVLGFGGAIGGAIALHSYWAIAFGTVLTPVTMAVVSYIVAPYRPRLSLTYWKIYSGFLGWFTVSQLIAATNWKLSRLVLGVFVTKGVLGSFSMAGDLCAIPEQALIRPTIRPLASGFAKLQTDVERLGRAYLRSVSTIVAIGLPPLLGMAMLAQPAIRLAMGPKWQSTPPIVTWLALLACLALITASFNALCVALAQTRRIFLSSLADLCVRLPATIGLTIAFGMSGTIAAQFMATTAYMLVINVNVQRMTGLSFLRQWAPLWRSFAAGALMVALLWRLRPITDHQSGLALFASTAAIAIVSVLAYLASLMLLWRINGRPDGLEKMLVGITGHLRSRLKRPLIV